MRPHNCVDARRHITVVVTRFAQLYYLFCRFATARISAPTLAPSSVFVTGPWTLTVRVHGPHTKPTTSCQGPWSSTIKATTYCSCHHDSILSTLLGKCTRDPQHAAGIQPGEIVVDTRCAHHLDSVGTGIGVHRRWDSCILQASVSTWQLPVGENSASISER